MEYLLEDNSVEESFDRMVVSLLEDNNLEAMDKFLDQHMEENMCVNIMEIKSKDMLELLMLRDVEIEPYDADDERIRWMLEYEGLICESNAANTDSYELLTEIMERLDYSASDYSAGIMDNMLRLGAYDLFNEFKDDMSVETIMEDIHYDYEYLCEWVGSRCDYTLARTNKYVLKHFRARNEFKMPEGKMLTEDKFIKYFEEHGLHHLLPYIEMSENIINFVMSHEGRVEYEDDVNMLIILSITGKI